MNKSKKILVVEDDEAILESLKELLEAEGYLVDAAMNGREALDLLKQNEKPALILLDLMMPEMDGYLFREEQKLDPAISEIPVLIMTADGQIDNKKSRLAAQAYFKKPIELESFLSAVKRFCS